MGVQVLWILIGNIICVLAHQYLGPWDVVTNVMSQEVLQEKEYAKRGNTANQEQVKINMPHVSAYHHACKDGPKNTKISFKIN